MISEHYILSGVKIREDFLKVNKELDSILKGIKKIANDLENYTNELQSISDNLSEYDNNTAKSSIMNKLTEIEIQGNKLSKIYKPVNDKLESLKKEEENLYRIIKENYPNLTDEEIISEFEPYIKKLIN